MYKEETIMINRLYERVSEYERKLEQAVIDMIDDIDEQDEFDTNITVREINSVIYDLKKILSEEK